MERRAKSPSSAWFFDMGIVLLKGKTMENMDSKHPKMGIKMDDPSIIGILTIKNGMNTQSRTWDFKHETFCFAIKNTWI